MLNGEHKISKTNHHSLQCNWVVNVITFDSDEEILNFFLFFVKSMNCKVNIRFVFGHFANVYDGNIV